MSDTTKHRAVAQGVLRKFHTWPYLDAATSQWTGFFHECLHKKPHSVTLCSIAVATNIMSQIAVDCAYAYRDIVFISAVPPC